MIPAAMKLSDLHLVLQTIFEWTNSHLHAFEYDGMWLEPELPGEPKSRENELYEKWTVGDVLEEVNDQLIYMYDFGDDWTHSIKLENILRVSELPHGADTELPLCIGGKRPGPLEDCGGPPGLDHMLKALNDPKHPEYEEYQEWAGGYEDEEFDIEITNEMLQSENFGAIDWSDNDLF